MLPVQYCYLKQLTGLAMRQGFQQVINHIYPWQDLAEGHLNVNLPIELFKTKKNKYIFDYNNVSFLRVNDVAYDVLSNARYRVHTPGRSSRKYSHKTINDVYSDLETIQESGLLVSKEFKRGYVADVDEIKDILDNRIEGITISITSQCNLGCSYCLYGGKYSNYSELDSQAMSWEVLKSSLDFLHNHSKESKTVRIDFFGGEPLLAFRLIKQSVSYCKKLKEQTDTEVVITIASNGTVLSKSIIDFIVQEKIYIQFSIDGEKDIHDKFRKFKTNGKGSHDLIMRNLKKIFRKNSDYYSKYVRLKGVVTPNALDDFDQEFFGNELIANIVKANHFAFVPLQPNFDLINDEAYMEGLRKLGRKLANLKNIQTIEEIRDQLNIKEQALYDMVFVDFFDSQLLNLTKFTNSDVVPFTKSCQVGFTDAVVMPDGNIYVCILANKGSDYNIGNVIKGEWDYKKISCLKDKLYESWSQCDTCFVQKFCDLCYEKINGCCGEWDSSRMKFCHFNRYRYRMVFSDMLQLMDNNPNLWSNFQEKAQKLVMEELKKQNSDHGIADKF